MAGERTFTEGEAYALVEEAVRRETAAAQAELAAATEKVTSVSNEKDALELRVTAAEEARAKAEQDLADYKAQVEREKAQEALRETRVAAVAEAAPKLELTDERTARIVAMDDEQFTDYVASLREVSAAAKSDDDEDDEDGAKAKAKAKAKGMPPRESAAFKGAQPGAGSSTTSVKALFGARAGLGRRNA